ncbi:MAG: hypothetical protein RBT11_18985 [Desulfobacterales bacterium]|nr:hypothetical protein [Desulfobacterales bacterium]
MDSNQIDQLRKSDASEKMLGLLTIIASTMDRFGGPISAFLSGVSIDRKEDRVYEVIKRLCDDLNDLKSEASEKYVNTEAFKELFEKTMIKAAGEQNREKRDLFRRFLLNSIKSATDDYDEQIRCLRIIEEMQIDHLKIIKVLIANTPADGKRNEGMQFPSLQHHLPGIGGEKVRDLVMHLNSLCVTEMTPTGVSAIVLTGFGRRFVKYIIDD